MNRELITVMDPKSPVSEMFKTLRTNIQFMNSDRQLKTLLISSTLPGEGKSWTASNLAVTFAQAGKRVLLIDADMRKGRQFNIFNVPPTPGLSNYLSGVTENNMDNFALEDFVHKTKVKNLFVMPAGNVPPNPSELLVSEKMLELNRVVKKIFDITVFDGTPSLIVTDATILARIVDSTIIVTAHNETKIDNVTKVKKSIENIGGKIAGVVINKVPITASKYESSYYYGSTVPSLRGKRKKHKNEFSWGDDISEILKTDYTVTKEEPPKEPIIDENIDAEPAINTKEKRKKELNETLKEEQKEKKTKPEVDTTKKSVDRYENIKLDDDYDRPLEREKKIWQEEIRGSSRINRKVSLTETRNKPISKKDIDKESTQAKLKEWEDYKKERDTSSFNSLNNKNALNDLENLEQEENKVSASTTFYWQNEIDQLSDNNEEEYTQESTQDVINQINQYLENEKNKLKNGGMNG